MHLFSVSSPVGSRPNTPKSDTECEYTDRKRQPAEHIEHWDWGEIPASSKKLPSSIVSSVEESEIKRQQAAGS